MLTGLSFCVEVRSQFGLKFLSSHRLRFSAKSDMKVRTFSNLWFRIGVSLNNKSWAIGSGWTQVFKCWHAIEGARLVILSARTCTTKCDSNVAHLVVSPLKSGEPCIRGFCLKCRMYDLPHM